MKKNTLKYNKKKLFVIIGLIVITIFFYYILFFCKTLNINKDCWKYYYKPINPSGTETIIYRENTNSLRVWIEEKTRPNRTGFYVTHIWAKNPYKQLKSSLPNDFGCKLETVEDLFNKSINKNNLHNKLAVCINGSTFELQEDPSLNIDYKNTSLSSIVIYDGKILRDFSNNVPNVIHFTCGIKKDNVLSCYEYRAGTNLKYNTLISKKIVCDGIQNTWACIPSYLDTTCLEYRNIKNAIYYNSISTILPIYVNYNFLCDNYYIELIKNISIKPSTIIKNLLSFIKDINDFNFILEIKNFLKNTLKFHQPNYKFKYDGQNIRNAFGQIDNNNFVLITDIYAVQRTGFSFEELKAYMLSINCKVGLILDGGRSTSLYIKPSSSSMPKKIQNPIKRPIVDILYFHEL